MGKKEKVAAKKETILVFGAHSDDFVIGAGGTIINYTKEGKKVISVVFSFGEKSHPWLKEGIVQKTRSLEAFDAAKILKLKQLLFYDLEELKFEQEYASKGLEKDLLQLIQKEKPTKIFTHSQEDPHPDHKAVNKITLELWEKITFSPKPEIYTYSVWNPFSLQTKYPALYSNISKTFSEKLKALKAFRSQRFQAVYPLMLLIIFRTIKDGLKIRKLFGEKFFRIK